MSSRLLDLTLTEAASAIRERQISPVELVREVLEQVERLQAALHSFITVLADTALREAAAAEAAVGRGQLGPLHGVPIAVKDNIETAGVRTTAGSAILADHVPGRDAPAVARLRSAGAILLGKTNLHEFAWGGTSDNPHYGRVRNPWDPERYPAGSSGGSAVAVAARQALAALGTDTAGSVRVPAAVNGVVGLRPTLGGVSTQGVVPLAWTMDTVGPLGRTAADCAVVFDVIAERPARADGGSRRLGVDEAYCYSHVQPAVASAVRAALHVLRSVADAVVPVEIPERAGAISAELTITSVEGSTYHQRWLRERPDDYGDDVRAALEAGELYLGTHYVQAQRYRSLLRERVESLFEHVDVLVTPTLPFSAPPGGALEVEIEPGRPEQLLGAVNQFTGIASLTGLPALSVPCGFSGDGMPIGLQLVGRPDSERLLLGIAEAYQQVTDWHRRRPAAV